MNHLSSIMTEHDESEQDAERPRRNREKVSGDNFFGVVVQVGAPGGLALVTLDTTK